MFLFCVQAKELALNSGVLSYDTTAAAPVAVHGTVQADYSPSYEAAVGASAGDRVHILKRPEDSDWWTVKVLKTQKLGFMPRSFIVVDHSESPMELAPPRTAEEVLQAYLEQDDEEEDQEEEEGHMDNGALTRMAARIVELEAENRELRGLNRTRLEKDERKQRREPVFSSKGISIRIYTHCA